MIKDYCYNHISISELCYNAVLEIDEIVNEFKFQLVLESYKELLHENSDDIIYDVPYEDTTDKKDSVSHYSVWQKIINLLKVFKEKVHNLLDKVILNIQNKIADTKLFKIYLSKNLTSSEFKDEVISAISSVSTVSFDTKKYKSINDIGLKDDPFYVTDPLNYDKKYICTAQEVYDSYIYNKSFQHVSTEVYNFYINSFETILYNKSGPLHCIIDAKSLVDKELNKNINEIKSSKDRYSNDDINEYIDRYSSMIKNNINVIHGFIKIWTKFISEMIKIHNFTYNHLKAN